MQSENFEIRAELDSYVRLFEVSLVVLGIYSASLSKNCKAVA